MVAPPADRIQGLRPMSDATSSPLPPATSAAPESLDSSILRVLMDTSADRIYFKDLQSRFVRNNSAHARSLGAASPEDCVGKTDFDFFSREHAEHAFRDEQEIIRTGKPIISQLERDRKSTRLNSSHLVISYAVFCLKK